MPDRAPVPMIATDQLAEDQLPEQACFRCMMENVDSAFSQKRRLTNYELVNREQMSGSSHIRAMRQTGPGASVSSWSPWNGFLDSTFRRSIPGARRVSPSRPLPPRWETSAVVVRVPFRNAAGRMELSHAYTPSVSMVWRSQAP